MKTCFYAESCLSTREKVVKVRNGVGVDMKLWVVDKSERKLC